VPIGLSKQRSAQNKIRFNNFFLMIMPEGKAPQTSALHHSIFAKRVFVWFPQAEGRQIRGRSRKSQGERETREVGISSWCPLACYIFHITPMIIIAQAFAPWTSACECGTSRKGLRCYFRFGRSLSSYHWHTSNHTFRGGARMARYNSPRRCRSRWRIRERGIAGHCHGCRGFWS